MPCSSVFLSAHCGLKRGWWLFALYSPILEFVPARSCLVSFTDSEGIEHSVRVPAESLYEAAVEAMAAFPPECSRGNATWAERPV